MLFPETMTLGELWSRLHGLLLASPIPVLVAVVLAGVVLLVLGWRLYVLTVVAAGAVAGAMLGHAIAVYMEWPVHVPMIVVAALFAVAAIPLQKLVFFLAGGVAAVAAFEAYLGTSPTQPAELILAGIAFAVGGLAAFLLFKPVVVIASSATGSALVVLAGLSLAVNRSALKFDHALARWRWPLLGLAMVLALAGMWVQASMGKRARRRKATE